jgi:O-antigen/teichoic acid export membrane protein
LALPPAWAIAPVASSEEVYLTAWDGGAPVDGPGSVGRPTGSVEPERIASLGINAVVQLIIRAIATRAITLVGTIALARLLTPEEFGVFAVVTVAVVLLTVIGDVGIGGALIQQAHSPTDRELATALTFQLAIWTAVLVFVFILAATLPLIAPDLPPSAAMLARLLGLSVWLNGLRAVPSVMLTRVLRFAPQAAMEVVQQLLYFGFAVALAATGFGVVSFGIAAVAQSVFATVALWLVFGHWPGLGFNVAIARRMWGFGLGYQMANALYWARDSVVAVFGGLAGGLPAIGFVQFGWRNGQFAISVEEIVARVAFPAFSRLQADPRRLGTIAAAAIEAGFLSIAVIQGWLTATAPTLVPIVFSGKWVPAVGVFQLICIGSLAWGPVLILRALVYARGDSRLGLGLATFNLAVVYILFPVLAAALGLTGAGIAFTLSAVIALAAYVRATHDALAFPWLSIARILAETTVASAAAALVAGTGGGPAGLVLSGVVYLATFAVLAIAFERSMIRRVMAISRGAALDEANMTVEEAR